MQNHTVVLLFPVEIILQTIDNVHSQTYVHRSRCQYLIVRI